MIKRKDTKKQKIEYYCPECAGTNVQVMCKWDNETQQWVDGDYDGDWCEDCDEPIRQGVGEREIK